MPDSPADRIASTIQEIRPLDRGAMRLARARQGQLTKPAGALGRLESLSVHLAGITGSLNPPLERKAVVVMAGDHGVTAQGVSTYPSDVTPQMVLNFLRGGAAINVLARQVGARVVVVDVGVASELPEHPGLVRAKVAPGTQDFTRTTAMTRDQAEQAVLVGLEVAAREVAQGLDVLGVGEMGIGNTTPAAALTAVFTGAPPERVAGRGTGLDSAGVARKVAALRQGLELHHPDPTDPIGTLAQVGGLEIAGLVGLMLGGAAHRAPVVVDGFITGAAALVAAAIAPPAREYLIASHRSVEPGHRAALRRLRLRPLLDLNLRLGEGSGAALAFPLLDAAVRILNEMATFAEAGVSEALPEDVR